MMDAELVIESFIIESSKMKFATLPYIEGQKYTLGDKFTSREDQGEFILWKLEHGEIIKNNRRGRRLKRRSIFICEINCLVNYFWVTPIWGNPISINDVEIEEKTRLNFGDRLSIRAVLKLGYMTTIYSKVLMFKKRIEQALPEVNKMQDLELEQYYCLDSVNPMLNSLIISQILSCFSLEELKSFRLISKIWNEEAFKLIRGQSVVHLDFRHGIPRSPDASMKLFLYCHEMRDNPLPTWKIEIPHIATHPNGTVQEPMANKFIADMDMLLSSEGHQIKHLSLGGLTRSQFDHNFSCKILGKLQTTLQSLVLSWEFSLLDPGTNYTFPSNLQFAKLEEFTLAMTSTSSSMYSDFSSRIVLTWMQLLAEAMKEVRILNLLSADGLSIPIMERITSFQNLQEISLENANVEMLRCLHQLEKSLKKIIIGSIYNVFYDEVHILKEIICKSSQTLTQLQFGLPMCLGQPVDMELPSFPQLKKLAIGAQDKNYQTENNFAEKYEITLIFSGFDGHVIYERHFPCLQSLTLWPSMGGKERMFRTFFPETDDRKTIQTCKTLRRLKIDLPKEGRILRTFPNLIFDE